MVYQWLIEKVTVTAGNIVTHVYWRCNGIDSTNIVYFAGVCELVIGDTSIPYDQLTEQQVLNWCFAVENFKTDVETQIAAQIASQIAQKAVEPALPWAN